MVDKIKPMIFDGENYDEWESSMLFHLRSKLLSRTLTERRPTDVAAIAEWDKVDIQALGKIGERVSPKFHEYIRSASTAKEAWEEIRKIAQLNATNMMIRARRELSTTKMAEGDDLYTHLSSMERCRRILKGTNAPVVDTEMIIRVMDSLPSSWATYLQGLRTQKDLMTKYEEFRNELLAEATYRKGATSSGDGQDLGVALQAKKFNGTCNNCKKPGHKRADCWAKGGGKEGQGPRSRNFKAAQAKKENSSNRYNLLVIKDEDETAEAYEATVVSDKATQWILDSGATDHMTGMRDELHNVVDGNHGTVKVANGQKLQSEGYGKLLIKNKGIETTLSNVLWIPGLSVNLVSVSALARRGATTKFYEDTAKVWKDGNVVLSATKDRDGLYIIDREIGRTNLATRKLSILDLHRIMGHLHEDALRKLPSMVEGLELADGKLEECATCKMSKAIRESFQPKDEALPLPGEELCADLMFINKTPVLVVSDKGSGSTFHQVLGAKSEAEKEIVNIVKAIEVQYGKQVKKILSDNGGEFVTNKLKQWAKREGIHLVTTAPYTPEQNGVAERKNRTLVEMCRALLKDSRIDKKKYWTYALATAVYIRNRSPAKSSKYQKTPFEIMTGRKPNLQFLRRFGEKGYYYVQKAKRGKLDDKARECKLLGYEEKCYILLDVEAEKIVRSAHVRFSAEGERSTTEIMEETYESNSEDDDETRTVGELNSLPVNGGTTGVEGQSHDPSRNSSRIPVSQRVIRTMEPMERRAPNDISSNVDTRNIVEGPRRRSALMVTELKEPVNYEEAVTGEDREKWREAVISELESLEENRTWTLARNEEIPKDTNLVDSKWVFKIKRDATGKLEKYKARLCARGFTQSKGDDYDETFAPVVRIATVRILLALTANLNYRVTQMDIVTAYLYSKLDKIIYMKPPPGMELLDKDLEVSNHTLVLEKGIYGLKQAGYLWNQEIRSCLLEIGLLQSTFDPGLYYKKAGNEYMFVTVYVDDILVSTAREDWRNDFEKELAKRYKTKLLGEVRSILGAIVECNPNNGTITIQQSNHASELGMKYEVQNMGQQMVPIDGGTRLEKGEHGETINDYRKALGSVMYISLVSRPDISYAVNYLGRFSGCCDQRHWKTLKGLLNYVYHTREAKLQFKKSEINEIKLCVDASHISEESHGVTGYIIYYADNPIIWKSKKQRVVALSSMEAEIVALSDAIKEVAWLRDLLMQLGFNEPTITIHEDNQACIAVSKNATVNDRTRHLMARTEFIRSKLNEWKVNWKYTPTKQQVADGLTKGLSRKQFEEMRKSMKVVVSCSELSERGSVGISLKKN